MPPKKKTAKKSGATDEIDTFEVFQKTYKKLVREFDLSAEAEKILKPIYARIDEKGEPNDLVGWNFTEEFDSMAFRLIMQALRTANHRALQAIRLWRCNGGDESVRSVCIYLESDPPPGVTELQIVDNRLTPLGCECLGNMLKAKANNVLTHLRLDHNGIGEAGVSLLADGLSQNATLRKLSLRYCDIGPGGGTSLGRIVMFVNSALTDLSVRGNHLGKEGIIEFLRGCRRSRTLKKLDLADNKFGETDDVLESLLWLFQHNPALESYNLLDNQFTDKGAERLLQGIVGNAHLHEVIISERISSKSHQAIEQALGGTGKKKGKKGGKKKKK